jgi:hypothetical protein
MPRVFNPQSDDSDTPHTGSRVALWRQRKRNRQQAQQHRLTEDEEEDVVRSDADAEQAPRSVFGNVVIEEEAEAEAEEVVQRRPRKYRRKTPVVTYEEDIDIPPPPPAFLYRNVRQEVVESLVVPSDDDDELVEVLETQDRVSSASSSEISEGEDVPAADEAMDVQEEMVVENEVTEDQEKKLRFREKLRKRRFVLPFQTDPVIQTGSWSVEEQMQLLDGVRMHGKCATEKISSMIPTRTMLQVSMCLLELCKVSHEDARLQAKFFDADEAYWKSVQSNVATEIQDFSNELTDKDREVLLELRSDPFLLNPVEESKSFLNGRVMDSLIIE